MKNSEFRQDKSKLLEEIYKRYHKPEYIVPDPLVYALKYDKLYDREIVALIAASFALGRVELIMAAVEKVLEKLGESPFRSLKELDYKELLSLYDGFCYRFFKAPHLAGFLVGIGEVVKAYSSLGECFKMLYKREGSLLLATHAFNRLLLEKCVEAGSHPGILVTESWKGSPFKRFNLFLRWMVRQDNIDPGGWDFIRKDELIVPLDTHMMNIGKYLGFTARNSPSFKTALDITESLKMYDKDDPVRFDFSLTRLGIHPDLTIETLKLLEEKNGKS